MTDITTSRGYPNPRPEKGIRMAQEGEQVAGLYPNLESNVRLLWATNSISTIARRLTERYGVPVSHKQVWNARPIVSDEG